MFSSSAWVVAGCMLLGLAVCRADDAKTGPAADVPQLKDLAAYIGTWEGTIKIKPSPWSPQGGDLTDVGQARWTLDGRFIEMRAESKPDNKHGLTLLTYDTNLQAYRSWWFNSDGHNNTSTGQFDPKTRTFTMTADLGNGVKSTLTDHFIDDNTRDWRVTVTDANGQVLFDMQAKSVKRKE